MWVFFFFFFFHIAKLSLKSFWINHFRSAHMFFNTGSTHRPLASIMCPCLKYSYSVWDSLPISHLGFFFSYNVYITVWRKTSQSVLEWPSRNTVKITVCTCKTVFVYKNEKSWSSTDFGPVEKQNTKSCPDSGSFSHTHHANMRTVRRPVGSWLSFPISHSVSYRMLYLWRAFDLFRLGAWTCNSASLSP